jgi:hypothetical protein
VRRQKGAAKTEARVKAGDTNAASSSDSLAPILAAADFDLFGLAVTAGPSTQTGGRVTELDLHGLGADGKYGTPDDTQAFGPGESGQGTFLLEGLKEGLHTVNFDLEAMLEGLPSGPVKVKGEVPGAVLVRGASFAVTFTHPAIVRAGQTYDLGMTLFNSGASTIRGAFAQLNSNSISGAELIGQHNGRREFYTDIATTTSSTVKWRLRSNTTGAASGQWIVHNVPLTEGPSLIRAVAEDGATPPNRGEASVGVTRRTPDTRPPTVNITSPLAPFETFDETISVAGTAIDDGLNAAGVARVSVSGRDASYDALTNQWSIQGVALAFGDNTIVVVATDSTSAANQGRAEIHVTRKQIPPPAHTIANPQNGAVLAATSVTVAGSFSSTLPQGLSVTVNGEPASINGGQYTKTVQLAEGANTITAATADARGQQTQLSASVVRDLTPPAVSFISTPASFQPGGSYHVTVDASDNIGVADVEFKVNGQHVETLPVSPYDFTLNVPAVLSVGNSTFSSSPTKARPRRPSPSWAAQFRLRARPTPRRSTRRPPRRSLRRAPRPT